MVRKVMRNNFGAKAILYALPVCIIGIFWARLAKTQMCVQYI